MGHGTRETVLLVEDTPSLSMVYRACLEKHGLEVHPVYTARDARKAFAKRSYNVVLLDLVLPDGDGLDILREMRAQHGSTKAVVITADGSINRAVDAMRRGAFDFLVKPFDDRKLLSAVESAVKSVELEECETGSRENDRPVSKRPDGFVGSSAPMLDIYRMIRSIGRSTATVFITGESGTGKEITAQAIHASSTRNAGPFVPINCGAIPRDLLESEVFGHLKGSFTGAISDKIGAAAAADGGTLFLDEICEMDLALQTKLLRFLQTSMIQPVGAVEARKVDVRIVCATNRDPEAEVRAGSFREDLYYRLHVVPIVMPPLRDRGDDVIEIAETLLRRFSAEEGKAFDGLDQDALDALRHYRWPGNVRQLENALRNAVVLNDGQKITLSMLPRVIAQDNGSVEIADVDPMTYESTGSPNGYAHVNGYGAKNGHAVSYVNGQASANGYHNGADGAGAHDDEQYSIDMLRPLVGSTLASVEREFIEVTIRECGGSIPRAARILDVSPSTLYRKREAWDRSAS